MKFKLFAAIEFEAKNLDDAYKELANHFLRLTGNSTTDKLEFIGNISLTPDMAAETYSEMSPENYSKLCGACVDSMEYLSLDCNRCPKKKEDVVVSNDKDTPALCALCTDLQECLSRDCNRCMKKKAVA
jgi:hypothetical protein